MEVDVISMISTSLERINAKLDKHDDKFDDMNEALRTLIKVDTEIKENKEALNRTFKRIEVLEKTHHEDGCPMLRDMEKKRQETLVKFENEKISLTNRIKILEDKPKDNMDLLKKGFLGAIGAAAYTWLITHFLK